MANEHPFSGRGGRNYLGVVWSGKLGHVQLGFAPSDSTMSTCSIVTILLGNETRVHRRFVIIIITTNTARAFVDDKTEGPPLFPCASRLHEGRLVRLPILCDILADSRSFRGQGPCSQLLRTNRTFSIIEPFPVWLATAASNSESDSARSGEPGMANDCAGCMVQSGIE